MNKYANLSGKSGIEGYEYGNGYIRVIFTDGASYLYTNNSAGSNNVERMKELATTGRGLNSFINKFVRYGYSK